ncbi:MAG: hypothetical protein LQ340_004656 [Diploschistes diacapsis]|nr:MAG: hypothetical protein LQ340_004656 [Diploschistes diacapsis]
MATRGSPAKGQAPTLRFPGIVTNAHAFAALLVLLVAIWDWAYTWLISGAPILTYSLLLGEANGNRILPMVPLWVFLLSIHGTYAVAATSWLLYWFFLFGCYPLIYISCIFQFDIVSNVVRKGLRYTLGQLDFIHDKIAIFDLPALEIDTEVDGLFVIRGLTVSLSSLTIIAHGVEVGIKLSDDMELALLCDKAVVSLFRRIDVGDVYANIKGGEYEMTFGSVMRDTRKASGASFMMEDSPLLRRATATGLTPSPKKVTMAARMTNGDAPADIPAQDGLEAANAFDLADKKAVDKYEETLEWIVETSLIHQGRKTMMHAINSRPTNGGRIFDPTNERDMRAAVCSYLHDDSPSIPHPPQRSIRVTTLQNLSSPRVRDFLHRLPMLLRLMLNILSYFHPVNIASITAGASGRWIQTMLKEHVFQHYGSQDSEVRRLEQKVLAWLADADFVLELEKFSGTSQVPFLANYNIKCNMAIEDVMVYRALPNDMFLKQAVRFAGADASITIPSFLLPHHEHLFPPMATSSDIKAQEDKIKKADGKVKAIQAQFELDQIQGDEANINMSVHARLPACLDQELLDFVAALVKATKIIEKEKDPGPMEQEVRGIKDFTKAMNKGFKDSVKRVAVDAVTNDKWIAKMVGKVSKNLESLRGDVGYSGDLPVPMAPYRAAAEKLTKLLP